MRILLLSKELSVIFEPLVSILNSFTRAVIQSLICTYEVEIRVAASIYRALLGLLALTLGRLPVC